MASFYRAVTALLFAMIASVSFAKDKVYVVGTDTEYVPFEFTKNGELVGFDVDVIKAIAKVEGIQVDFHPMSFDGIIPALQSGAVDAGSAGMSITPERAKVVDFSDPYMVAGLGIMTLKKNGHLDSLEKLKGLTLGTQLATVAVPYLAKHLPGTTVKQYQNINNVYLDLEVGRTQAVVFDYPSLAYYANAKNSDKVVTAYLTTDDYYGIAFKKGSPLRDIFNAGLKKIIASGQYEAIVKKWFGNMPQAAITRKHHRE